MTQHFFDHPLATINFYKFGTGVQKIICFHGYGMHGKQFKVLEPSLGHKYTFYGLDLFFHKETKLKDQSLAAVKKGISKKELAALISDFCVAQQIKTCTVIGYSMGTHYATAITEELRNLVTGYIAVAPSCLNPGFLVKSLSKYKPGNLLLEKLVLSKKALVNLLSFCKRLRVIDEIGYQILHKEIETPELRFNFYACFTYLRFLETNEERFIAALNQHQQKPIFIFGKRDLMYPPKIGNAFFKKLNTAKVIVLDENHEMINHNFATQLTAALL